MKKRTLIFISLFAFTACSDDSTPAADTGVPDTAVQDMPTGDTVSPDTASSDTTSTDTTATDTVAADTVSADTVPACTNWSGAVSAWWRFEGDLTDSAGSANGTDTGGPNVTFGPGKIGQAASCANSCRVDSVPGTLGALDRDLSIETWVRTTHTYPGGSPQLSGLIFSMETASGIDFRSMSIIADGWQLSAGDNGGVAGVAQSIRVTCGNQLAMNLDGTLPINDGNWHHVVGVCDTTNDEIRLYIDGTLNISRSSTLSSAGTVMPVQAVLMHSTFPALPLRFKGDLDEFTLHDQALTAGDVTTLNGAAGGRCP